MARARRAKRVGFRFVLLVSRSMARLSQVALAGSQGASLFSYSQASDPPLILAALAPVASSVVVWHSSGAQFLSISTNGLHVSVWKPSSQKLYDVRRVSMQLLMLSFWSLVD